MVTGSPHHFAVNATIVDLDMKKDSLAHFRKYKKQYHESKEAYFDYMKNKKIVYQDWWEIKEAFLFKRRFFAGILNSIKENFGDHFSS